MFRRASSRFNAYKQKKPPPARVTAFFMPFGVACLGAFALEGKTGHAEEEQKTRGRLRGNGGGHRGTSIRGIWFETSTNSRIPCQGIQCTTVVVNAVCATRRNGVTSTISLGDNGELIDNMLWRQKPRNQGSADVPPRRISAVKK